MDVEVGDTHHGWGDHIIGLYHQYLYNVSVRELCVSLDHRMLPSELRGCGIWRNLQY